MTVQLLHLSDLHFGARANIELIEALEALIPQLKPHGIVVSGDLSQRARHGEFQRARAFVRGARRTAPVYVLPGNHDVSWWWRPLGPFSRKLLYAKYRRYFGTDLAPTLTLPGAAVIAGVLTSDGAAWGSWTWRLQDLIAKGHLPKREYLRVRRVFAEAAPELTRVLVVHHNVLQGETSGSRGLTHWRRATRRIVESGAEVVFCGHDHQDAAASLGERLVVSTAGTLSQRLRGGRPASFNVVAVDPDAVVVTPYRWEEGSGRFQASMAARFDRRNALAGKSPDGATGESASPTPTRVEFQNGRRSSLPR